MLKAYNYILPYFLDPLVIYINRPVFQILREDKYFRRDFTFQQTFSTKLVEKDEGFDKGGKVISREAKSVVIHTYDFFILQ